MTKSVQLELRQASMPLGSRALEYYVEMNPLGPFYPKGDPVAQQVSKARTDRCLARLAWRAGDLMA